VQADDRVVPCLWRPIHRQHLIVSPVLDARWPEALRRRTGDEVPTNSAETVALLLLLAAETRRRMRPRLDEKDQQDCH
jgi:hypothetical protein